MRGLTWVEGDDHVWQLHSQTHALYEGMVCRDEARPLCPMAEVDLVLVNDHLQGR